MGRRIWIGSAPFLLALAGCRAQGDPVAPQTELERAIYLTERDTYGAEHPISSKAKQAPEGRAVERLARKRRVDVNSEIEIHLLRDEIAHRGRGDSLQVTEETERRIEQVRKAVAALAGAAEQRLEAVRRWEALQRRPGDEGAQRAFREAKDAFDRSENDLLALASRLWPADDLEARTAINEAAADGLYSEPFQAFLQGEIDGLHRELQALLDQAGERALALRMKAFLIPSNREGDPAPIHLPHYDELDQKEIRLLDPRGLALTRGERQTLDDLMAAADEIAAAANSVARDERSIASAIESSKSPLARQLARYASQLEEYARSLESGENSLDARMQRTRAALESFGQAFAANLANLEGAAAAPAEELEARARARVEETLARFEVLATVAGLPEKVREAQAGWEELTPARLPSLVSQAEEIRVDLQRVVEGLRGMPAEVASLRQAMAADLGEILGADPVRRLVEDAFRRTWRGQALEAELGSWVELAERGLQLLRPILGLVQPPVAQLVGETIHSPGQLDVPLDDAQDTSLDLRRTERQEGDLVELHYAVVEDGEEVSKAHATFQLTKLGWHADLVPSIVVVRADHIAGGSETGGLSPELSWMWSYGAREEDQGWLADGSRALGWSVGLHAIFLNLDNGNDVEMGLGVAGGLWDDRLHFGVGYNPFADSDDDGRYYYYVGSSLIPILQALQGGGT